MKLCNAERQSVNRCCTPSQAWAWAVAVAEMAVDYGDKDAAVMLASCLEHWLDARRFGANREALA